MITNEIQPIKDKLIDKNISDTYSNVTHCNLPNLSTVVDSHKTASLYDGLGNKLSYSFNMDNGKNIHNQFINLYTPTLSSAKKGIITNSADINKATSNNFYITSGTHTHTLPDDYNTKNGVNSLDSEINNNSKLIANVEYLTKSLNYSKDALSENLQNYLDARDWTNLIASSVYSTNAVANTGKGCNNFLIFASCNIKIGECHGRTDSIPSTTMQLRLHDKLIDSVYLSLNCCYYRTTGNKSPSSYADWIQSNQNVILCGCYNDRLNENTNYNISIQSTNGGTITHPYILCIRCKIQ